MTLNNPEFERDPEEQQHRNEDEETLEAQPDEPLDDPMRAIPDEQVNQHL